MAYLSLAPKNCAHCQGVFAPACLTSRFCSRDCFNTFRSDFSQDNFWDHVHKSDGCWIWTSACNRRGYGVTAIRRKYMGAHKKAWILTNGPVPAGLYVCHHCDNPPCVRPDHLFLGTNMDNVHDMIDKGRVRNGEKHPQAKLTELDVMTIRAEYKPAHGDGMSLARKLAEKYGVTAIHIWGIAHRKTWKHI